MGPGIGEGILTEAATPAGQPARPTAVGRLFARGGQLGARLARVNWSAHPLGPPQGWPPNLKTTLALVLSSRARMVLFWGQDLHAFYNDPLAPLLGAGHPGALAQPARDNGPLWGDLEPHLAAVFRTGESACATDHPFPLDPRGYPGESYFDISFDPIRVGGGVRGVLGILTESTGRVVGERRLRALADLDTRLAGAADGTELARRAADILGEHPCDVPFAVLFLPSDRSGDRPVPAAWCGVAAVPGAPIGRARSHLRRVLADGRARTAPARGFVADPPAGGVHHALVLPVVAGAHTVGALVAGVRRHHVVARDHRMFLDLVAAQVSWAVGRQRAEDRVAAEVDRLDLRLPANANRLALLRRRLERFLAAHGVSEHDSFDLQVAVSEAAANAIEHPLRPTEPSVRVTVEIDGDDVVAEVRDSGAWRTPAESPVRGRGLAMIGALVDLDVRHEAGGTVLTMRRRLRYPLSASRHPASPTAGDDSLGG
jgi:anti-sigma regulatory factor (Ser/Thr protein kinase)